MATIPFRTRFKTLVSVEIVDLLEIYVPATISLSVNTDEESEVCATIMTSLRQRPAHVCNEMKPDVFSVLEIGHIN